MNDDQFKAKANNIRHGYFNAEARTAEALLLVAEILSKIETHLDTIAFNSIKMDHGNDQ